ncbi:MAG: ABC transporter ATP-binding protein [Beijerinckiaceae bacterium]
MAVLETHGLTAFYGDFQALFGITFALNEGETVAIVGANGAGKSTFLKAIAGLLPRPASAVRLDGREIGALPAFEIVKLGIALVPEGRRLFPSLSVEENLLVGAYGRQLDGPWTLTAVYRLFPVLQERRRAPSTALSGGQQQMVAIGRSLMSNPRILLCDELSLGLAPIVIRDIYAALADVKKHGTSVVLVEQDLVHAMSVADRAYCFQEGRVSLSGRPQDLTRDAIHAAYFGL